MNLARAVRISRDGGQEGRHVAEKNFGGARHHAAGEGVPGRGAGPGGRVERRGERSEGVAFSVFLDLDLV